MFAMCILPSKSSDLHDFLFMYKLYFIVLTQQYRQCSSGELLHVPEEDKATRTHALKYPLKYAIIIQKCWPGMINCLIFIFLLLTQKATNALLVLKDANLNYCMCFRKME